MDKPFQKISRLAFEELEKIGRLAFSGLRKKLAVPTFDKIIRIGNCFFGSPGNRESRSLYTLPLKREKRFVFMLIKKGRLSSKRLYRLYRTETRILGT